MKNKISIIILSSLSFLAFGFDLYALYCGKYQNLLKLGYVGSAFLFACLYFFYLKRPTFKKIRQVCILAGIFSFFMIFGNSYMHLGNALLIFRNVGYFILSFFMTMGYYFLFEYLLSLLFRYLDQHRKEKKTKLFDFFSSILNRPMIFILLCWLPYILSFYPIILSPDPSFQIKQFFGIRTKYADYSVLLDENVVLTNHHPVLHTTILGSCLKIGRFLGSDNFGLFLYSSLQVLVLAGVLAFSIHYMKKMKISSKFRLGTLLVYALVPMFPLYAMSGVKDVFFSAFTLLYMILIHHILKHRGEGYQLKHYVGMIVLMLLIILFRNNGLHMIVLSFPFVIFAVRRYWKQFTTVFVIVMISFLCYSKVLLPYFHITPGSIREMLSVPFQQTARFVKYHEEEVDEEERKIIDFILGYETLAKRYNPELADPVKNQFNKYTTSDDLKKYFGVWVHQFLKSPVTYIDATIQNTYGFFYPEKTNWYVYYKFDKRILEDGFDYHYNRLSPVRNILSSFAVSFPEIPVLGMLSNIGFSVWIIFILIGYSFYKKWYDVLFIYLPAFILILVCIVGPANTYFRYALPYIFSLWFMISCVLEKTRN